MKAVDCGCVWYIWNQISCRQNADDEAEADSQEGVPVLPEGGDHRLQHPAEHPELRGSPTLRIASVSKSRGEEIDASDALKGFRLRPRSSVRPDTTAMSF